MERKDKNDLLQKMIDVLAEQNIPVLAFYMNEATRDFFTTGDEDVDIRIDNDLPDRKFVYVKPGEKYNPGSDFVFTYWAEWGGQDIISERMFSQKRRDLPKGFYD